MTIYFESQSNIEYMTKGPWFEPTTMRFFRTSLPDRGGWYNTDNGKIYFVTTELAPHDTKRMASIRVLNVVTGKIDTVGEFYSYSTYIAKKLAKQLAFGEITEEELSQ